MTLCRDCHMAEHRRLLTATPRRPVLGRFYGWHQIEGLVGCQPHGYLTEHKGKIMCGCFKLTINPDAPDIVLPGTRHDWIRKALLFEKQGTAIPTFIKAEGLPWEYAGRYRAEALTRNSIEIAIHRVRAGHRDIGLVMFLSR